MGLDMFLWKRKKDVEDPQNEKLEELIYWRKANQIHNWFTDKHPDSDNGMAEVDEVDLDELKDLCEQVLEDRDSAERLLPTQAGFFFGDTDYDEYYFEQIQETKDKLDEILEDVTLFQEYDVYYGSWW